MPPIYLPSQTQPIKHIPNTLYRWNPSTFSPTKKVSQKSTNFLRVNRTKILCNIYLKTFLL
ncbi:hypothetical protein KSP40_PGU022559 [Platanthera guangdongensis]|uniref:Uncharacterized protein n=1 Tax=Platanthera guangdongensis TaxID=2320717 RepID=A0ABR2LZN1_9ASPA